MKKLKIISVIATFSVAFVMSTGVLAQPTAKNSAPTETTVKKATEMTNGEVRKIDKESGKVTLRHDKIENLDMPGMTMVFKVKDMSMLDNIQVGDKVKFKAKEANGKLTVTEIKVDK